MSPVKCAQCGALIDPLALACPYCQFTTPAGVAARQRAEQEAQSRAQWHAHAQYQHQVAGNRRLESAATQALVWSIVGVVLCCLPLGVVGIVMGARARSLAKQMHVPPPAKATVGLVLGVLSSVSSVGLFTWAMIEAQNQQEDTEQRIAAIEKRLGDKPSSPALDRDTACGLAEIYARRNGWAGHQGYTLEAFECVGKIERGPDRAQLEDFRFKYRNDSKARYELNVCLKRGAQWYVGDMREGPCGAD